MVLMTVQTEVLVDKVIRRKAQKLNITIENQNLKHVNVFKYLRTTFSEDGKIKIEIDLRCNKANQILGQSQINIRDYKETTH